MQFNYHKRMINEFGEHNRTAPMQIIFFRDRLSDGRYAIMGKEEIEDITGVIDDIWQNLNLKTGIKTNFLIVVS
ncbi:hypothetical protein C8R48DRAFT_696971, partial [Suillus tomentosus]